MTFRARPRFAAHAATLALLSLVLLFRTLIPAGYMIAPSGGWPVLTLCETPVSPASAHHQGHDAPATPEPRCAYAALASPALSPTPPLLAASPSPPEPALPRWTASAGISLEPASLPPPSTGPPALV